MVEFLRCVFLISTLNLMKLKTPELRCVIFVLLCLGFVQSLFAVRSIPWRPERLPGSSRLSIDSIRWLVLPPKADEDLLRAANDLAEVFKLRGIDTEIVEADGLKPRYAIIISPYGRSSRDLGGGPLVAVHGVTFVLHCGGEVEDLQCWSAANRIFFDGGSTTSSISSTSRFVISGRLLARR